MRIGFRFLIALGLLAVLVAISVLFFSPETVNELTYTFKSQVDEPVRKPEDQVDESAIKFGDQIDHLNGVAIFYNGAVSTTKGRNRSEDGYNLGLRYQCVEFVKRYYYERLDHRMPNTWGHAKDFFDPQVPDGEINRPRALRQFRNGSSRPPQPDDLIIFGPTTFNQYGHVAIVSKVELERIEIAQQNPGPRGNSRATLALKNKDGTWKVGSHRVLGWLRLPTR